MRILHVLDHSLPNFSGYSFRSDYIIRTQKRLGLEPFVVTSPKHENFTEAREVIDGIEYHRLRWRSLWTKLPVIKQAACGYILAKQIKRLAGELKIDLIHAHSPATNGLAAARAAKALGLPWVYELRYYDEDAAVDRGKITADSLSYSLSRMLEISALDQATRVTTISRALKDDLVARGIAPEKITEIPNGVDTETFSPSEPDAELIARYGLQDKLVIGFIGSFYFYEGLNYLIDAMLILLAGRSDLKLLLVGDGEAMPDLRGQIPEHLQQHFIFTGNIAHAEVRRYYSIMDVVVYPRISSRLTELTTPLKPLEAMAMARVVVGSRVGGISELIVDGQTGLLVDPDQAQALADCLANLTLSKARRRAIGERARAFVESERGWESIVSRYFDVYEQAINEIRGLEATSGQGRVK